MKEDLKEWFTTYIYIKHYQIKFKPINNFK